MYLDKDKTEHWNTYSNMSHQICMYSIVLLWSYYDAHGRFSWLHYFVCFVLLWLYCHSLLIYLPQWLTLSIWFTCPLGTWFWKFTCPSKIFTCPANICASPVKLMYTAGKISICPEWKMTCPVGHVTTEVYVPWDKIYMSRACRYALMLSPVPTFSCCLAGTG